LVIRVQSANTAHRGLEIDDVVVRYGDATAVDGVTLDVSPGQIVAVIGPSGCGKSSLLRAVAGLEPLHRGAVRWAGDDLAPRAVHQREFGLMFQDHVLFPHRDVGENVAFGLRMHRADARQQRARVTEMLALVGLAGFERRRVDELSGGEAQRVALARALAPRPRLLMLDEPLGSLDRSLRERLAVDIRTTVRELGVAALHITHDQDEAFTVADRVAVMRSGRIVRADAPEALWRDPRTEFVARFLGHRDVLPADVAARLGYTTGGRSTVSADADDGVVLLPGALVVDPHGSIPARVIEARFGSVAVWAELAVDGFDAPLTVTASHGSPEAEAILALVPGATASLALRSERTAAVALEEQAGPDSPRERVQGRRLSS
jgi:thiamine transport system ATP-binding protein